MTPSDLHFSKITLVDVGRMVGGVNSWWKWKRESCPILYDPMNSSGSSVHGILQARILEWVAIPFSRVASQPRDRIWISCIADRFFTVWATREDFNPWYAPKNCVSVNCHAFILLIQNNQKQRFPSWLSSSISNDIQIIYLNSSVDKYVWVGFEEIFT